MRSRRVSVAVFVCSLMLCVVVGTHAQSASAGNDDGGWVIAAYLGGTSTSSSGLAISQPAVGTDLTFNAVRFSSRSFSPPLYYGLRGGYFLRRLPKLGFEAEFIHLKVFSDPQQPVRVVGLRRNVALDAELPLGQIVQQYSVSHGVNLLLFNLAARHRFNNGPDTTGRLALVARAGVGPTIPHTESRVEGIGQEQYEFGRIAWQVSGGAEFRLWRGMHLLGEYKFTRTRQHGKVASGTAESLLRTNHGVFGVGYYF